MAAKPARYIVMSKQGFVDSDLKSAMFEPASKPVALKARAQGAGSPTMRVLDSIGEMAQSWLRCRPKANSACD